MTRIFTYGTLKVGLSNSPLLHGSEFVGAAVTKPLYRLYDCGPYPCLVRGDKVVRGEVYNVSAKTLERLDRLEGVPFLYQREEIELEGDHPTTLAYFYQGDTDDFIECDGEWPRK